MRSIHVVDADGREEVVVIRSNQQNPAFTTRLNAVRNALGNDPGALEVWTIAVRMRRRAGKYKMKKKKDLV